MSEGRINATTGASASGRATVRVALGEPHELEHAPPPRASPPSTISHRSAGPSGSRATIRMRRGHHHGCSRILGRPWPSWLGDRLGPSVMKVDGHALALREAVQHPFERKFAANPALLEAA